MRKLALLTAAILMLLALAPALAEEAAGKDSPYEWTIKEDGTLEITGYTGSEADLTVPAEIGGIPVTSIGRWAFESHGELVHVTLPEGLTAIGGYAFASCSGLTRITLPDSLRELGDCAFILCTALPEMVIPAGVETVGANPVAYCTVLKTLRLAPGSAALILDDDAVYAENGTRLVACLKATKRTGFTVREDTETIGAYAFAGCKDLTEVRLPDSLTDIEDYAFYYCAGLASLTVPESTVYIADTAFFWCGRLVLTVAPDSAAQRFCDRVGQAYLVAE